MTILDEHISTVANDVFSTMLDMEISEAAPSADIVSSTEMAGCVQISGEWRGAIIIQTTERLVHKIAEVMLDADINDISAEDTNDTLAELANIIGGNIKALVPGPSYLSLPSVTSGQNFDFRLFGAELINEVPLRCVSEPLRILVCQEDQDAAARRKAKDTES